MQYKFQQCFFSKFTEHILITTMNHKKTYTTRLSLYIISLVALIFCLTMAFFYEFAKQKATEQAINRTDMMLTGMVNNITMELMSVETTIKSVAWLIEEQKLKEDSICSILKSIVKHNPFISGSAIAYLPNRSQEKETELMFYASRNGSAIECKKVDNTKYHYLSSEWFDVPVKTARLHWSEPYFDDGIGNMYMCTFSMPILDSEGSMFAVLTADISLNEFKENIQQLKPHKECISYFLSREKQYITDSGLDSVKSNMVREEIEERQSLKKTDKSNSKLKKTEYFYSEELSEELSDEFDVYIFHTTVPCTDWSIWSTYPRDAIMDQVYKPLYNIIKIALLGLILLFLVTYFAIKRLVAPLRQFAASAKEIATGNFNVSLPVIKSQDEMLDLRQAFEYMQQNLATYVEELRVTTTQKKKIENELSIAKEIQQGMLPRRIKSLREKFQIDLDAILKPVKEVGGDLYDFFMLDNKLFFFIGDVSGKGVPAALFMATTRSLLRAVMTNDLSAEQTIRRINSVIDTINNQGMFVTCFFAILDTQTGRMEFCNAGHNPPVIIPADGDAQFLEVETNIAVGLLDDYDFVGQSITITPGTKIVLYTDGVVEAEDNQHKLYSDEKLIEVLNHNRKEDSKSMIKTIEQSVEKHSNGADQSDDLAILILEYKPQQSKIVIDFEINNKLEHTVDIERIINRMAVELNISESILGEIRLALEEIVVNTIMYGYEEGESDTIKIQAERDEHSLTITIRDRGRAFDPTLALEPDLDSSAIGGLGIYLVRNIMDGVTYRRIEDMNQLIMTKNI